MLNTIVANQTITLLPQKALIWNDHLFLADLHLGKISHFRKSGLPLPPSASDKNLERLIDLIRSTDCTNIYFLGDLFHSHYNEEWESFKNILHYFEERNFYLIEGNHDILSNYRYTSARLQVKQQWEVGPFLLTHEPMEEHEIGEDRFNICGHIHPGVSLMGKGRQKITLPCFYFSQKQGILPAFGDFTGNYRMKKRKDDSVFIILNGQIIQK